MPARRLALSLTIALAMLLLPTAAAQAAGCDKWEGGTGNWNTPADWSTHQEPTAGAEVCIESGKVTVLNSILGPNETLGSLKIENATVEVKIHAIVPVSGTATIGAHGALILNGTYEGANGGNASLGGGTVTNNGTITMEGEGYTATLYGTITNNGTINVPFGNVSFGYGGNGGAASLDNKGTINISPTSSGHASAPAEVEALGAPITDDAGVIHNEGTFVIRSGGEPTTAGSYTQGNGSETGNSISIGQNSTLHYTGTGASSVEVHNSLAMSGNLAAGQKLQIDIGTVATEASSFSSAGAITLNGNYYGGGGGPAEIAVASGTFTNTGTLLAESNDSEPVLSGNLTNSGTVTIASNTVVEQLAGTFTNAAEGTLSPQISSRSFGELQPASGATFAAGGTLAPVLIEGFVPTAGQEFDVVNDRGGTSSGTFATVASGFTASYTNSSHIAAIYGSAGGTPGGGTTGGGTTGGGTTGGGTTGTGGNTETPAISSTTPTKTKAKIAGVSSSAGLVTVKLTCPKGGGSCGDVTVQMTVTEKLKGGRVIALSAAAKKTTKKVVLIATGAVSLSAGATATLKLKINSAGKALLRKYHSVKALATITAGGAKLASKTVTLKG
jgi:hypothetical protein